MTLLQRTPQSNLEVSNRATVDANEKRPFSCIIGSAQMHSLSNRITPRPNFAFQKPIAEMRERGAGKQRKQMQLD